MVSFGSVLFRIDLLLVVPAMMSAGESKDDRVDRERRGNADADAVHYPSVAKVTPAVGQVSTTILSTLLSTLVTVSDYDQTAHFVDPAAQPCAHV